MKYILIIILFVFLLSCNHAKQISKNPDFTIAKILETPDCGKSGFSLVYKYKVNNIVYIGEEAVFSNCREKFIGKYFPVVYYKENPKHSILIVSFKDFQKWNLPYPDSLKWTYECTKGMFDL